MTESNRSLKAETVRLTKRDFTKSEIFVEFSFGPSSLEKKHFSLSVDPNVDVRTGVKQPIAEYTGIPLDEIHIYYRKREFDDSKSLSFYGLLGGGFFIMCHHKPAATATDAAEVNFRRRPPSHDTAKKKISITINDKGTGKRHKISISPSETVEDIKKQVEKEAGVPASKQQLSLGDKEINNPSQSAKEYGIRDGSILDLEPRPIAITVKTPSGKVIKLQVQPSDTTSDIKDQIERETGLKVPQQILKFQGQELPNGKSLESAGVKDGAELVVEIPKIHILVNDRKNEKKIKLMVDPADSITQIKKQLEKESGIPVSKQKLTMNGQEFQNPNRSSADCGIRGGSVLDLEPKPINITVRSYDGKISRLQVNLSDKASDIKARVEKETGIKIPQQILKFQGKEMLNGKSLEAAGVKDESELVVEVAKVAVTVNTSSGKMIQIMVDPTDTISGIKQQLEKESGIPSNQQKLSMNGKELSNPNQSADECGIRDGSVLYLEPKPINITVRLPSGKTLKLQVKPDDKVSDIKARVETETGLKVSQQLLKYLGQEMPNGKSLEAAGVKDGSELVVEVAKIAVTVNTSSSKMIQIMVDPTDTISGIKKQLEKESGIPINQQKLSMNGKELCNPNQSADACGIRDGSVLYLECKPINITIRLPSGKTLKLQVKPDDKVSDIKARVEKETGLKVSQQLLKYLGQEMPNGKSLEAAGVKDGSELVVEVAKIAVTVNTSSGKMTQIMVDPTDTISGIKQQLEKESGIPINQQKLSMNGKELCNPNQSADACGIRDGSVLYLECKPINITIRLPSGKTLKLQVKPDDKVSDIKARVEKETGLKVSQQLLKYLGQEMPNGKSLEAAGVKDGSELVVEVAKIAVTVNTSSGKMIQIMVDPTDTISGIKQQLEKESGIPINQQKLSMNGKELCNPNQSADACGIRDGSVLYLEPKPINITVRLPSGKTLKLQVNLSDKASDIKARVEKETGIKIPQQILKFHGKEMPNGKSLEAAGVKDESELVVEVAKVAVTVNTSSGKMIQIMVDPTDTISGIKQQLEKESGIPINQQKLSMNGKELSNPNQSADACGIRDGSVLYLEPKPINITVRLPSGKTLKLQVKPDDKVSDIKARVETETGLKVSQQLLKYLGQEMPNGKSLEAAGVKDGSELVVEVAKIAVTVNTSSRKRIQIMVDPTDTISGIKKQLEKESGIPSNQQKLSMNGKELCNPNQSADACGIRDGSVLYLERKPINITIRLPSGKTLKLQVKPDDKVSDIKARIEKETGLKASEQLLKFHGKEIPNMRSMEAMGVQEESELTVEALKTPNRTASPSRPKEPLVEAKKPITTSDVFVALTIPGVNSNPSANDYSLLAEKTKMFYALQLRKKHGSAFQDIVVLVKNSFHGSDKPNKNYNIYIEWEIKARFDESAKEAIPDRNGLIRSLVQVDLLDYLKNYVRSLSGTPFAGATGMFTEQVNRKS
jgi:predicted RNase H-related nuclease YkuK (DUF458 family)/phosphatidylserine decarboxylase